ncbi:hypothetical protein Nepgr_030613 [Nepenthes gracilis]|uniref:Uncharacterized protein n=1 Tax=Nepenthes gracilis TaxID=150966 RepID=A0AAD3Y5Z5_NEPGR|nr:hypothetical protein Nepgr_030613 [Nepenthes gracilis]
MKILKEKFVTVLKTKHVKIGSSSRSNSRVTPSSSTSCEHCYQLMFSFWNYKNREEEEGKKSNPVPKDVPKGHVVVYVGRDLRRYVIRISLLNHPLFGALLDQARDEYDFTTTTKLCIPCDESMFIEAIRCASSPGTPKVQFRWL